MKVPRLKLRKWKELYSHRDYTLLSKETGKDRRTISKAINEGKASIELIKQIDKFYNQRKQEL